MKSDKDLRQDVLDELGWNPLLRNAEIAVAVKDGVVTLAGTVGSYSQKRAAEATVSQIAGVRGVAEELEVHLPHALERSNTEIAHAAIDSLVWDVEVPNERVQVSVENGWITLRGDVEWMFQRKAAERAVRNLTGVRGVTNLLVIKPVTRHSDEVANLIRDALRRNADVDAGHIRVHANDGQVTLTGHVRSWAARRDAERAAWSAPGVREVVDQLSVSS